jgi:ER lumen protein retaining receptor
MSSNGAYARYQSNAGGSNPYGQSYGGNAGGYGGAGYGGATGGGYGSGPAPGYGDASYSAPQYPGAAPSSGGYGQPAAPMQTGVADRSKKGKKSVALQALNKNVYIWAGFFTVSLFVYFLLSGGDFSFLMTYGAMSRMFGFGILNVKTWKSQRATGVSAKTLQLYCIVFFFRLTSIIRHEGYLPYDKSGDWLYHFIEIMALIFTAAALYGVTVPFKATYQADCDRFGEFHVPPGFGAVYLAAPIFFVAICLHPNLNADFVSDVAWTYAMYLESVAVIPQLYMFQKQSSGVVELLTAHFVAALGFGRVMEFIFWIYSYHELATSSGSTLPGYLAIISQFAQLVLMVDFFWYYFAAVKNATPLVLPSHNGGNMV